MPAIENEKVNTKVEKRKEILVGSGEFFKNEKSKKYLGQILPTVMRKSKKKSRKEY
jgi:hypothetical protein